MLSLGLPKQEIICGYLRRRQNGQTNVATARVLQPVFSTSRRSSSIPWGISVLALAVRLAGRSLYWSPLSSIRWINTGKYIVEVIPPTRWMITRDILLISGFLGLLSLTLLLHHLEWQFLPIHFFHQTTHCSCRLWREPHPHMECVAEE